jgi:transposase
MSHMRSGVGLSGSCRASGLAASGHTCQFKTLLHARILRVDCPGHGVVQVKVPWAENKGRFTLLMERLIIDVLTECATLTGARPIMRITWDEAWGVMKKAVRRGRKRKQSKLLDILALTRKCSAKGTTT